MAATQQVELEEFPLEATEALTDGTLLQDDQFTIIGRLGNGGFGITYLAHDNYLDRNVVIKECFPEIFCRREGTKVVVRSVTNRDKFRSIVEMFTREARSIAKMRHPNIIGVHRIFEDNDTAYIALDLIDGKDLLEIIRSGKRKLSPTQIKDILIKLLDAVALVHSQDMLHRDISPDNILIDRWGNPVLIDFGATRDEASRETRALSAVLVVKDGYSPQEFYFAGGKQTPASDLYALGATFYHVISGMAPPNSQTRMADVASGGEDPCKPLAGRFPGFEPGFLEAIDKAMRVLPKDRVQSVRQWINMIDANPSRPNAMHPPLPVNKALEKTLTRLVSETNEQLSQQAAPAQIREHKRPEAPKPELPDWVREFNAESSKPRSFRPHPPKKEAPVVPQPVHVEPRATVGDNRLAAVIRTLGLAGFCTGGGYVLYLTVGQSLIG